MTTEPRIATRNKGLYQLVACLAISVAGLYMMLPLLALFLTQKEHLPTSEAALLVVALTVSEQGPMFLTGAIADRFERQRIISIGFIFGAVGYFLLSLSNPIVLLAISVMLIGFGNALIMPSCKAVVSEYARHIGKQAFTLRTTATNVGGALGPIIGALTYGSFRMALTAISVVYVLVALIVIRADLPSVSADRRSLPLARRLRIALTDRRAVRLTGGSLGYWVCYAQFSFAIPLYTASRLSWDGGVALLFTANSVTIILLQYPIFKRLGPLGLSSYTLIALGMACISISFIGMLITPVVVALCVFVVMFSLGELLVSPMLDSAASEIAPSGQEASYLGFVALAWALGSISGNSIGSLVATRTGFLTYELLWMALSLIALITALFFFWFHRSLRNRPPILDDNGAVNA